MKSKQFKRYIKVSTLIGMLALLGGVTLINCSSSLSGTMLTLVGLLVLVLIVREDGVCP